MKHIIRFDADSAPNVQLGVMISAIRRRRVDGRDPLPGDTVALYAEYGTPRQRLLIDTIIEHVSPIVILPVGATATVIVGGHPLERYQAERIATSEGFDGLIHMVEWYESRYGLPFFGNIIVWAGPLFGAGYTH